MTDPLSDLVDLLAVRSARCTRFEAAGRWAFRFPPKPALKFVAVLDGDCLLRLDGAAAPITLAAGDTFLLAHAPGYVLASDLALEPADGIAAFDWAHHDVARHGGAETVLAAGTFVIGGEDGGLIADALPPFVHVPAGRGLQATLALLEDELASGGIGTGLVTRGLGEILLVRALRVHADAGAAGWLGALGDPKVGAALRLLHRAPARAWTVGDLAAAVGMSRAAFAARFSARLGLGPLAYLTRWRMHMARRLLRRPGATIATVAASVGYASDSAFGHAFKRLFGEAPKQYATRADRDA